MTLHSLSSLAQSQWYRRPADQRYETLESLHDAVAARRATSRVELVQASRLVVDPGDGLRLYGLGPVYEPPTFTNWSFAQLCQWSQSPAGFLRQLQPETTARVLNERLKRAAASASRPWQFFTHGPEDAVPTLAAVTSETYGRIWDAEVVEAALMIRMAHPRLRNPIDWNRRPSGLYASDRDVFIFLCNGGSIVDGGADLRTGGDADQLFRGLYLWNSEVGSATFGAATFLFRSVCGNHLITGMEDERLLTIRHTGAAPARFANDALPAIEAYLTSSAAPMEQAVRKAKQFLLPAPVNNAKDDPFLAFFVDKGFTKSEVLTARAYAEAEEGGAETLWQMMQGFTRASQDLAWADARLDLDRRAGALLEVE